MSNVSSGSCLQRVESGSVISQVHSSAPSSGPSTSVSRKPSSSMKNIDLSMSAEVQATVEEVDEERLKGRSLNAGEAQNSSTQHDKSHHHQPHHHHALSTPEPGSPPPPHRVPSNPSDDPMSATDGIAMGVPFSLLQPNSDAIGQAKRAAEHQSSVQSTRQTAAPRTEAQATSYPGETLLDTVGPSLAPPPPTPISAAAAGSAPLSRDSLLETADTAIVENSQDHPLTTDMPKGTRKTPSGPVPPSTTSRDLGEENLVVTDPRPPTQTPSETGGQEEVKPEEQVEGQGEEQQEQEVEEEEEDDEEDEDEEEEEEEENKASGAPIERCEPQTIHVMPPEKPPSYPALFTHCQYFYIGAGRWQVYLQMWFIEDRLKREAYIQVFDYEWHNCERVADIFETSRCLNRADRPSLIRYLGLARHNCPLIDGEIQVPGSMSCTSQLNAFELHEKLTALRLHQQAKEMLNRDGAGHRRSGGASGSRRHSRGSNRRSDRYQSRTSSGPSQAQKSKAAQSKAAEDEPKGVACAEHMAQFHTQQQASTEASTSKATTAPVVGHVEEPDKAASLFFDIGSLAPRNSYCALCDTHEYLHRLELPAYLISPCYHCRESLAKEAKITPEMLLDLHLQNHIPWPAFLQARFKLPVDDRTLDELIVYDCRWRSRHPCRCLVPSGGPILPPCVEFPWLYPQPASSGGVSSPVLPKTDSGRSPATPVASSSTASNPVPATASMGEPVAESLQHAVPAVTSKSSSPPGGSPAQPPVDHPSSSAGGTSTRATPAGTLPCSHRHSRGAPTTCCHNIIFPRMGTTSTTHQQQAAASGVPETSAPVGRQTSQTAGNTVETTGNPTVSAAEPGQVGSDGSSANLA